MNLTSIRVFALALLVFIALSSPVVAQNDTGWIKLGFEENWRDNWREITFPEKKSTSYDFDPSTESVCGSADESASALVRSFPEGETLPTELTWEWRVDSVLDKGNARKKSGDDYAGRVYVNFEAAESLSYWDQLKLNTFETIYGQDIPSRSINFIWANRLNRGTIVPSPYTQFSRLVALRNRQSKTGTWQRETVNLKKYYQKIFDEEYRRPHSVSIMTDTDDTESLARGCYRNLRMSSN